MIHRDNRHGSRVTSDQRGFLRERIVFLAHQGKGVIQGAFHGQDKFGIARCFRFLDHEGAFPKIVLEYV